MIAICNILLAAGESVRGYDYAYDIPLTLAIMAIVVLTVVGVFSQGGTVRISPQRQNALATGHTDRRTVFESPILGPLAWVMLAAAHRMRVPGFKKWVGRKLVAAGDPDFYTPEEYMALAMLAGLGIGMLLEVLDMIATGGQISLVAVMLGFVIGVILTFVSLYEKAASRVRLISKRVPYALDLIALAMGAGATFIEAVKTIIREQSDDPLRVELAALLAEMELGATRKKALTNLSDRIPLDSLRTVVASIIQAEEMGTPLADVLQQQATLMRMQRSARAEDLAAVASVRILVPCLLIVMAVILAGFAPVIVRAIRQGGLF
jgi:tight adherence protein C